MNRIGSKLSVRGVEGESRAGSLSLMVSTYILSEKKSNKEDRKISERQAAAQIERILRSVTTQKRSRKVRQGKDLLPEQINELLKKPSSLTYSGDALPIIELCLLFKIYKHPKANDIIRQLIKIGKRQHLCHPVARPPICGQSSIGAIEDNGITDFVERSAELNLGA